jgi:hypothetical protein
MWERDQEEWALRNIKLRFSRKLLFVWGLLACFSFELFPPNNQEQIRQAGEEASSLLADFVQEQTNVTPIDMLSRALLLQSEDEHARSIFDSYDLFLTTLDDNGDVEHCEPYQRLQRASWTFRDSINAVFFDGKHLGPLVRRYGVF